MKKEIIYLSSPDYFNKFVLTNFNQRISIKDKIKLHFKLSNNYHLGFALKAISLLETIFPQKSVVLKIFLKKKKLYFGQKSKNTIYFTFNTSLSSIQFIEFFRFFSKIPFNLKKNKTSDVFIVNRKFKPFEFNRNIFLIPERSNSSFFFLKNYHLN